MSLAKRSLNGNYFSEDDLSSTLDNCSAAVSFIGSAVDSIRHNGGEVEGDAVARICMMISDALEVAKERASKAEGGAQ